MVVVMSTSIFRQERKSVALTSESPSGAFFTIAEFFIDMLYMCRQYYKTNMAKRPVELTEAEWTIIKAIWATEPCTATAIQERLHQQTHWSYSTVRTIMDRMVVKRLLTAQKCGKVTLFHSMVTQEQAQRGELLYALKNAFDGALTPMVQCLLNSESISAKDLAELEAMIEAKKKSTRK